MKNLGQFFDYKRFFEGKKFVVTDNQPYLDFETKKPLGRKVEVAIQEDNTVYTPSNTGQVSTNLYEKMKIKVLDDGQGNMNVVNNISSGTFVTFDNFKKASLYINKSGFMELSIECMKCEPVKTSAEKK